MKKQTQTTKTIAFLYTSKNQLKEEKKERGVKYPEEFHSVCELD